MQASELWLLVEAQPRPPSSSWTSRSNSSLTISTRISVARSRQDSNWRRTTRPSPTLRRRSRDLRHRNRAEALFGRGSAFAHKGEHQKALADFDEGLRLKTDRGEPFAIRCVIRAALGQAFDAVMTGLRHGPDFAEHTVSQCRNFRGYAFLKLDRPDRAMTEFNAALQVLSDAAAGSGRTAVVGGSGPCADRTRPGQAAAGRRPGQRQGPGACSQAFVPDQAAGGGFLRRQGLDGRRQAGNGPHARWIAGRASIASCQRFTLGYSPRPMSFTPCRCTSEYIVMSAIE